MSDGGINARHKERWAAATAANDDDPHLPTATTQALQEQTRLEWVKHTKGEDKPPKVKDQKDGLEEAEGTQEEDPGEANGGQGSPVDPEPAGREGQALPRKKRSRAGSKKSPAKRSRSGKKDSGA